jgi:DNA primase
MSTTMADRLGADAVRRALTNITALVVALRLEEGAVRQAHGILICCLWHSERNASCSITLGPDGTIRVHCFGCGLSGDAFHLIARAHGLDVKRDFPKVRELAAEIAGLGPSVGGASHTAPRLRPAVPTPSPRTYPPREEVLALLEACTPVFDDIALHRDLEARGIDPATVTDRRLAFALPGTISLPRWARSRGGTWSETEHRCIVPMYDASGQIVTVRARRLLGEDRPKALTPAGYRHDGAVMADPLSRLLLAGQALDWWTQRTVLIEEGEPDWLTAATHFGDDEGAPAVMGVVASSWSAEIAARIPDGARVIVRTHADPAGHQYASEIAQTLVRRCHLRRPASCLPQGGAR